MPGGPIAIELFSGAPHAHELSQLLRDSGYEVGVRSLHEGQGNGAAQLLVIDGASAEPALRLCHRLRVEQNDRFTPILFVASDAASSTRLASLQCGADTALSRPFEPAELLAQIASLIRIKERHDHLATRAAEAHRVS